MTYPTPVINYLMCKHAIWIHEFQKAPYPLPFRALDPPPPPPLKNPGYTAANPCKVTDGNRL